MENEREDDTASSSLLSLASTKGDLLAHDGRWVAIAVAVIFILLLAVTFAA